MDFFRWFFVESKVFEFLVHVGGSVLRLVERRKEIVWVRMVEKYCIGWLKTVVEKMACLAENHAFTESSRDEDRAFYDQIGANRAGRYLEVAEYAMGGRRGLIFVPEGRDGRGGKTFAKELPSRVRLRVFSVVFVVLRMRRWCVWWTPPQPRRYRVVAMVRLSRPCQVLIRWR